MANAFGAFTLFLGARARFAADLCSRSMYRLAAKFMASQASWNVMTPVPQYSQLLAARLRAYPSSFGAVLVHISWAARVSMAAHRLR